MHVNTLRGTVVGAAGTDGVVDFYGVPFAEAPRGDRRFAPPVPRRAWSEPRYATTPGPTPQRRPFSEYTTVPEPSVPGDDTLLLNVHTPAAGDMQAHLPVLVWIHGGGYFAGSPSSPWYAGRAFARAGIVVVSLSYRLGFLGFGTVAGAAENRGVRDWVAGLEWVQQEIRAFGGDPGRVTIAGQSAGGGAVTTLLSMQRSQHLFHRVIAQSPAIGAIEPVVAGDTSREVARSLGLDASTVDGFSGISEEGILDAQAEVLAARSTPEHQIATAFRTEMSLTTDFGPVRDGDLIPQQPLEAFTMGVGANKQLLIGTTADEFVMTTWGLEGRLEPAGAVDFLVAKGLDAAVARRYSADNGLRAAHEALGRMTTDTTFRRPVARLVDIPREGGTWLYDFRWRSPGVGIAMHCTELPFMWGVTDDPDARLLVGDSPPAELADLMQAAWIGFIRDGDPGWPAYTAARPVGMVFDAVSWLEEDPYAASRL